jgi:hypothetical protein
MPFADLEVKYNNSNNESKFKRTEFMQMGAGAHTVRILQGQAKTKPTHFFKHNNVSVLCLEDECPVCANNKSLWQQFDKEARKQSGYNPKNYRFFVNVFDKTPAKTCGKCGKEYKNLGMTVCTCGEILPEAKPLNKVKVLSKGLQLRDELDSIDKAILGPDGTPIGLTDYDMVLMVSGSGKDTKTTPVPRTEANQPVDLGEQELFDLDKALIVVNPEEMLDIQRGVSLKDIFSARKAKTDEFVVEPAVDDAEIAKVNAAVDALFK